MQHAKRSVLGKQCTTETQNREGGGGEIEGGGERKQKQTLTPKYLYPRIVALGPFGPIRQPVRERERERD